jgi:hypothetical protein
MAAMRAHYHSGQGGDFFAAQPQFLSLIASNTFAGDSAQTTPEILRSVNAELSSKQQAVADASTTAATGAANNLKASKDVDDFKAKMMAQRDQAKADSDANIDKAFDKAVQLGVDHPEMQSAISIGMNVVKNVISGFTNLLQEMVSKVVSLVEDILKELMETFNGVIKGFASEAGELLVGLL